MIELDHFSDWDIKRYLRKRLPSFPELFLKIEEQGQLLSTLRRPLLLKLFADVVIQKQKEQTYYEKREIDIDALLGIMEAAQLIGTYVDLMTDYVNSARAYAELEQNKLNVTYIWNNDKLAMRSVELYKKGKNVLSEEDLEQIRELASYASQPTERQEPFLSIYKCPFLLRVDKNNVRFAHRIFLEYFTARGLVMEAEKHFDKSDAFNTLVLSTDMRKFLKFMVNTNKEIQKLCKWEDPETSYMDIMPFHIITRRSYGLLDPNEWSIPNDELTVLLDRLDEVRISLLNGMTDPEKESSLVESNIKWFLENEDIGLHPKYLMYCHEGTAAYLYQRRWSGRLKPQSTIFNDILHSRMQRTIVELQNPQTNQKLINPLQLLAERIFDIAFRLRYEWVTSYAEDENIWLIGKWDADSKQRIDKILKAVRQTIF